MATPAETLKELHRLKRLAKDLQARISQIPRQLQNRQEDLTYQQAKLTEAHDRVKQLRVAAMTNDLALKTTTEQIRKYESQLGGIISKKEYDALNHEIAHARQQLEALEDAGLSTLTDIDEWTGKVPEREQAAKQAREELARYQAESPQRAAELGAELERTLALLAETEAHLPEGDFQVTYQRLIRQKGDDAFAAVRDRACQACYTAVTAQMYNELRGGMLSFCKACGRIIYLAE